MAKPENDTLEKGQFVLGLIGTAIASSIGVVSFVFMTFATKSEVEAKASKAEIEAASKSDDKILELMRQDLKEVKDDVKLLIRKTK